MLIVAPVTRALSAEPTVVVAKRLLLDASAETPFPIQIKNAAKLPKNTFVRIRGSLTGLQLSQGHRVSAQTWAVPLAALSNLTVKQSTPLPAPRAMRVMLVALDGTEFRTFAMSEVTLYGNASQLATASRNAPSPAAIAGVTATQPPQSTTGTIAPGTGPSAGAPPPRPALSPAKRAAAEAMLTRGNTLLANGSIDSARLFFQRAARAGLPEAALAMAGTYDPVTLRQLTVVGVKPDVAEAKKWYTLARDLGSVEAVSRLRDIEAIGR